MALINRCEVHMFEPGGGCAICSLNTAANCAADRDRYRDALRELVEDADRWLKCPRDETCTCSLSVSLDRARALLQEVDGG